MGKLGMREIGSVGGKSVGVSGVGYECIGYF